MKRSDINRIIANAKAFFAEHRFYLPPFAHWTPDEFRARAKGPDVREILDVGLGWDITDFGLDAFEQKGLVLFTVRNGHCNDERYPKSYAEKIMIVGEEQLTLTHYHWKKTEDIINRGGGNLVLKLHNATTDNGLAETPVTYQQDGMTYTIPAGGDVTLQPGESITLPPRVFHSFWGEAGCGAVMVGEVSAVNDDHNDNCFYYKQLRFPEIEEDEAPLHLLVGDYAGLEQHGKVGA